jgi:hypothetical protein
VTRHRVWNDYWICWRLFTRNYKQLHRFQKSNYRGILSISCQILSNTLSSRLIPYVDEIIGNQLCGLTCSRSTTDHILCFSLILEQKWEFNETVLQLFIDFKKTYDSLRKEVLCKIHIESGVSMKQVRLFKMCLNKVRINKYLSDTFPIRNALKQGNLLKQFRFKISSEYAIRKVQEIRYDWNGMGYISCWSMLMMWIYWVII